jgi:anti-sigma regulatory factor (Ser/Thr protein kinase)/predicted transcriptional regulator
MARRARSANQIRRFILETVAEGRNDIVPLVMPGFGVSRATASRYVKQLVDEGLLEAEGTTRARRYSLPSLLLKSFTFKVAELSGEDKVWRDHIMPLLKDAPSNIVDILQYGATEMINNVIDHSEAEYMHIHIVRNAVRLKVIIHDDGVGVFEKIKRDCHLDDTRQAMLELSKGKLTTAPSRHSGEGLFFTSRMCAFFALRSHSLAYLRTRDEEHGWLLETKNDETSVIGTQVTLEVNDDAKYTMLEVFEAFQDDEDPAGFSKTHVPVRLAKYPGEQLVSRSQARRVLARFERFSEVMLDFDGVPQIGQAFADEIFRVYALEHPEVEIIPIRMLPAVERMIAHVLGSAHRS